MSQEVIHRGPDDVDEMPTKPDLLKPGELKKFDLGDFVAVVAGTNDGIKHLILEKGNTDQVDGS